MRYEELRHITLDNINAYIDENRPSGFLPFETRTPSTMTLVITFNEQINKDTLFHLLPITYNPNFPIKRRAILYTNIPGIILNCRYMNMQRGPCFKGSFKNSVICDVSTTVKNISVKISNNSFQMCGVSSVEDGCDAANIIIKYINEIIRMQVKLIKHQEEVNKILKWLERECKGDIQYVTGDKHIETIRNRIKSKKVRIFESYVISGHYVKYPDHIPEEFNQEIVSFFLQYIEDIKFNGLLYEHYILKLRQIIDLEMAIDSKICYFFKSDFGLSLNTTINICSVNVIMANYNYNVGYKINREKLAEIANYLTLLGIHARFDIEFVNHASIDILYKDTENLNIKRNPRKPTHHSLICYRTGSVTQSSGGIRIARDAYNILKYICDNFRDEIEDKTGEFSTEDTLNSDEIYDIFNNARDDSDIEYMSDEEGEEIDFIFN